MSKIKIDPIELEHILKKNGVDAKLIPSIVKDSQEVTEENKADSVAEKGPKGKYKYVLVANTSGDTSNVENIPIWIAKIPEEADHTKFLEQLAKAGSAYNTGSRKGKKNPVRKYSEVFECVGAKFFKPGRNPVVTKEPVIILTTDNEIAR